MMHLVMFSLCHGDLSQLVSYNTRSTIIFLRIFVSYVLFERMFNRVYSSTRVSHAKFGLVDFVLVILT